MFRSVPLSIIRSFSLYTQQWYMSYRFADSLRAVLSWSCLQAVSKPVWHIPLLCVQWKTLDDGQRNCPKHIEFYSKNKFKKLAHLVGFIRRISHDARSPESQNYYFKSAIFMLCVWTVVGMQHMAFCKDPLASSQDRGRFCNIIHVSGVRHQGRNNVAHEVEKGREK